MLFSKHFRKLRNWYWLLVFTATLTTGVGASERESTRINAHSSENASFQKIYTEVFSDPYKQLPYYTVTKQLFGQSGDSADNLALQAARRSLSFSGDLYDFPQGKKIFQANGICFSGTWRIQQASEYTGLLKKGTDVPVIVRASVALDGTLQKHKRAFGMAIKFFPNQNREEFIPSINLFVMNSLGGVKSRHILDLEMDNAPELGALPPISKWGTMLRLQKDFSRADREVSGEESRIEYRPVDNLARFNNTANENPRFPTWLKLTADENISRVDQDDFRDELQVEHYTNNKLVWNISVAEGELKEKHKAQWLILGVLELNESVVSKTCDQRLHFQHPSGLVKESLD